MLSEIGRRRFACVEPTASLDTIESLLLDEGSDGLPVIDDAGHLIGMVSKAELLRRHRDRADDATSRECATHADVRVSGTAADVMVPAAHALPEDAPLSFGIALLAVEELAQVPIVNEAGVVVGLFSSSDAVRWLALQMGYVVKSPGA